TLGVERREFALKLADDGEVQMGELTRGAMAQDRACLARIVVAVVAEKHDAPADLRLKTSRGPDLGHEEPPRGEAAGLLATRDDRRIASVGGPEMAPHTPQRSGRPGGPGVPLDIPGGHAARRSSAPGRGGRIICRATLKTMQAAQP